jgi:hypothetical protein
MSLCLIAVHTPCAHIAAPTLFEIENISPMIGILSNNVAVKPKTIIRHELYTCKTIIVLTPVIPLSLFYKNIDLIS